MLIIPELKKVVIFTPRTGSGSLRRALQAKFPASMLLYRHMEAAGVPTGYDRWEKIGFIRDPLARLYSLYQFMNRYEGPHDKKPDQGELYVKYLRNSVDGRTFEEWLLNNDYVFTSPFDGGQDAGPNSTYYPHYNVLSPLPENRKSQFVYLRPDLGTRIVPFEQLHHFAAELDLDLPHENATGEHRPAGGRWLPMLGPQGRQHMRQVFAWDYSWLNGQGYAGSYQHVHSDAPRVNKELEQ